MSGEKTTSGENYKLPSNKCLQHAWKIAIVEDKDVKADYWNDSLDKKIIIGVKSNQEKLLVKSEDEYTSPISNIYKIESEYIIVTENSIYLVSSDIDSQRIS
tara:strand:+ start:2031 stop:2336 length:306 start_codon:yes stop_codon:yes gene_type:complete